MDMIKNKKFKKYKYSYNLKSEEKSLNKKREYELIHNWQNDGDKKILRNSFKSF